MQRITDLFRALVREHGPGGSHAEAGCRCCECRPDLH